MAGKKPAMMLVRGGLEVDGGLSCEYRRMKKEIWGLGKISRIYMSGRMTGQIESLGIYDPLSLELGSFFFFTSLN